jgi:hypothetical protein
MGDCDPLLSAYKRLELAKCCSFLKLSIVADPARKTLRVVAREAAAAGETEFINSAVGKHRDE